VKLFGRYPPDELFDDYFNRIEDIIWNLTAQIIKTGVDVIIDNGFWSKEQRAQAMFRAKEITNDVIFHSVECDMETAKARVLARTDMNENELGIDENAFELFRPRFQPICESEGYKIIVHKTG